MARTAATEGPSPSGLTALSYSLRAAYIWS